MRAANVMKTSLMLLVAFGAAQAGAQTLTSAAACRAQASSYAQGMVAPQPLGDAEFFSKPSGPPNIMFLLGNNTTMQDFPNPIPVPGNFPDGGLPIGCSDDAVGAGITSGYFNKDTDGTQVFDPTYTNEFKTETDKAYTSYGDRLPWDGNGGKESGIATLNDFKDGFKVSGITGDDTPCGKSDGSKSRIAQLIWGSGYSNSNWSPYYTLCRDCMQNKGWFRGPKATHNGKSVYTYGLLGRFLNKYPPKYAIARKVIADVSKSAGTVRLGISVLSTDSDALFDPVKYLFGGAGARLKPDCDKALAGTGFNDDRPDLLNNLKKIEYTEDGHGLGEALFSIGGYYADESWWETTFSSVPTVSVSSSNSNVVTSDSHCASGSCFYPNTDGTNGFSNGSDTWIQGSGAYKQEYEGGGTKHMSLCFPCQVSSVIILSDSTPNADNTVPVTKMDSLASPAMPINPGANPPGGVNTCVNFCGGMSATFPDGGSCRDACDQGASPLGPERGNRNFMDDVSYFLAHTDLRPDTTTFPGTQIVHTYTILFGNSPDPMLQGMASAGLGQSYVANNAKQLQDAIFNAIADIQKLSTSGASPSLANVQASGTSTAFIPRFHPVSGKAFWPGDIRAYDLYAEPAAKCTPGGAGDLDSDGSCTGIYLIDKNFKRIAADVNGDINPDLPGLYYEVDSSNNITTTRAVPFWSAAELLGKRDPSTRKVYTVVDTTGDGDVMGGVNGSGSNDGPTAFTPDNWATLLPYLGIANDPYFCSDFSAKAGIPEIATDTTYETCARMLIRYVLGYDVLNEENASNGDGGYPWTNLVRGSGNTAWANLGLEDEVLGDIFHSPPQELHMAEPEAVCDSQNFTDCLPTIHAGPTPIDVTSGKDAYLQWQADQVAAKQANVIAVGANDGMLHVFKANCWFDGFQDPSSAINTSAGLWPSDTLPAGYSGSAYKCDSVTSASASPGGKPGEELFAFIPPDLLPKLKKLVGLEHTFFVDGAPMVRHIWVDGVQDDGSIGSTDNKKQKGEFRDVMIVGERTGGTHYFALDMTDPLASAEKRSTSGLLTAGGGNRFLWLYPKLSDSNELAFGETWNDTSGKPPPIGPIRLKSTATGALDYTTANGSGKYVETWAAFLNGGNDALGLKGRGLYIVNAWTGATLKEFSALAGNTKMLYPFAAAVGAFNWGNNAQRLIEPDNKYFFDTATVGDTGGQLWTLRFYDPDSTYWAAGRALQEAKGDNASELHRFPIYDLTSNYPTSLGFLRTLAGTGDRQHLHDTGVGQCGFGNIRACITQGCNVDVKAGYGAGTDLLAGHYTYSSGSRNSADELLSSTSPITQFTPALADIPTGATACAASFAESPTVHIWGSPCNDTNDQPLGKWVCSDTASSVTSLFGADGVLGIISQDGGGPLCFEQSPDRSKNGNTFDASSLGSTSKNRFMSVRVFENSGNRGIFNTVAGANTYDTARLSDTSLASVSSNFTDGGFAADDSNGWVLTYPAIDERDSSNPQIPPGSGCIVWNTVQGGVYCAQTSDCCDKYPDGGPNSSCGSTCNTTLNECQSSSPCSRIGTSSQFTYSADAVTGNGGCGVAFQQGLADGGTNQLRRVTCTQNCSALPPPAPAAVTFVASDGTVRTAIISATGRDVGTLDITKPDDLLQLLYDVPISEPEHQCRHEGNCP